MSKINDIYNMATNKQKQNEYNDEMVRKTWHYKKKYGFETSPRQGHEFWNNEADAFKHAFGSAEMFFKYGNIGSLVGGIYHENQTPNNPREEWNMDSWNNSKGREIAKEIQKEYGKNFSKLSKKQQDDIIAEKIMQKMKDGQLITYPDDSRKFNGFFEKIFNNTADLSGKTTGQAAPINTQQSGLLGYANPLTGNNRIFTREDVGTMTPEEFAKHEKEIDAQTQAFNGTMPTNSDLQREAMTGGGVVYVNSYTRSDGTKVSGYYRSK